MSPSVTNVRRLRWHRSLCAASSIGLVAILIARTLESNALSDEKQEPTDSESRKIERKENRKGMEQRARGTTVHVTERRNGPPAQLIAKPLFHYTDEPRRIVDATLWDWRAGGWGPTTRGRAS